GRIQITRKMRVRSNIPAIYGDMNLTYCQIISIYYAFFRGDYLSIQSGGKRSQTEVGMATGNLNLPERTGTGDSS
ncbi:MAG: hypothetical protein ACYDBT_09180, partial [Desulfobulbaceae bacterium]